MDVKTIGIAAAALLAVFAIIRHQDGRKEAEVLAMLHGRSMAGDGAPGVAGVSSAFDECRRQKEILTAERDGLPWIRFRARRQLGEKIRELPC